MPEIGEKLPNFVLPRDGGNMVTSDDLLGKTTVLYFYPRDNTPGCTEQSIGFSESLTDFECNNAMIVGVSKDNVKSHDKFVSKQTLKIPLLSDENGQLCEDMGVWVEKKMYGKTFMGIERATFIINAEGVITHIWRKVKVPGHVEEVLQVVQNL